MVESQTKEFKTIINKSILKEIVELEVQQGDGKPYYLADKGMRPNGVYKRLGNTSVPVSEQDIRNMIVEYHNLSYETSRSINQELTFDYARKQFELRNLNLGEEQMVSLGFYNSDGLFNNLALLLSDQCPHIIKAAIFKGNDKTEFKHRTEFGGSLLKQLDDVFNYIETQNFMETSYDGLRRIDRYNYSQIALREGLLNAIIHRDYGMGGSVFVNLYKDKCEFVSLGSLAKGIHLEDIFHGVSKSRNEKLASVFYRLELVEAFGTGIMKIMAAYKKCKNKPEFNVTPGAFILKLPSMLIIEEENAEANKDRVKEEAPVYDVSEKVSLNINLKNRDEVLNDLKSIIKGQLHITRLEVQSRYGFGQTKSGQLLKVLEEEGFIEKKGSGKNSYYEYVSIKQ